jgi:N-acetylglutamate synthase-like GNAT family acetyltransferase
MNEIDISNYFVYELTEKYLNKTAQLINSEWPRAMDQRLTSLKSYIIEDEASNKNKKFIYKLPVSLILIDRLNLNVVAHASLVSIATTNQTTKKVENLVFLQTLVVDKALRGKGLGKKLIISCESYINEFSKQQILKDCENFVNCDYIYLTTKDQQAFYEKVGYKKTEAILFFSLKNSNSKCSQIMNHLISSMQQHKANECEQPKTTSSSSIVSSNASGPLPPPPPPPPHTTFSNSTTFNCQTWYKKYIAE